MLGRPNVGRLLRVVDGPSNPRKAIEAINTLAQMHEPSAVESMTRRYRDILTRWPDGSLIISVDELRYHIEAAIFEFPHKEPKEILFALPWSRSKKDDKVTELMVSLRGTLGTQPFLSLACSMNEEPFSDYAWCYRKRVWLRLLWIMGELGDEDFYETLIRKCAKCSDTSLQGEAVAALTKMAGAPWFAKRRRHATQVVCGLLPRHNVTGENEGEIAEALSAIGDETALAALVCRFYTSMSYPHGVSAVRAIASRSGSPAFRALLGCLDEGKKMGIEIRVHCIVDEALNLGEIERGDSHSDGTVQRKIAEALQSRLEGLGAVS